MLRRGVQETELTFYAVTHDMMPDDHVNFRLVMDQVHDLLLAVAKEIKRENKKRFGK